MDFYQKIGGYVCIPPNLLPYMHSGRTSDSESHGNFFSKVGIFATCSLKIRYNWLSLSNLHGEFPQVF